MKQETDVSAQFDACPFCNSDAVDVRCYGPNDGHHGIDWRYRVECKYCGAALERETLEELTSAWNRRDFSQRKEKPAREASNKELQKTLIILLAQSNMNVSAVVRKVPYLNRKLVDTEFDQIKRETGKDPRNFFDLHELYRTVTSEVSEYDTSPDICKYQVKGESDERSRFHEAGSV